MNNHAPFFFWLVQPDGGGKLRHFTKPIFRPYTTRHLDMVVKSVVEWYTNRISDIEYVEMETDT